MAAPPIVKGPSLEYFEDFEEACAAYVTRIFPGFSDWKSLGEKTFMFPPCFPCRYLAPTDHKASGFMPPTKNEMNDIKGDDAELKIFRTLDKFGRETGQPMFVLTQLKFEYFTKTKDLLSKGLIDELFSHLSEEERKCTQSGEIDFLIIHRHIGIILIEVKATERFKGNRYGEAKKQLDVSEKFVRSFLRMIQSPVAVAQDQDIPLFKVVAMPNVPDRGKKSDMYITLCGKDLEGSKDAFKLWWESHIPSIKISPKNEQGLLRLVAVLVGQRATVCATSSILENVYQTIDKQRPLSRSYDKQAKNSANDIRKVDDEPDLKVLVNQFVFLNPEQLLIWEGPTRQIFCGAPGSGKTILLQHKALECAKKKEFVVVFVPPPLHLLYIEFFKNNGFHADSVVRIIAVANENLEQFITDFTQGNKCHIFIDEFQVLLNTNQRLLDSLKRFLTMNDDKQYYQWIVYDNLQLPMANEMFGMERSNVNIVGYISELHKEGLIHAPSLTTVMRNTSEVYTYLQKYLREYSNVSGRVDSPSAASHDLDTYWKHEIHLGHRVTGPEVILRPFADREAFFSIIQDQIDEWAKVESDDKYCYSKVAVLVAFQSVIIELRSYLQCRGIPVCEIGSTKNAVVVDFVECARSFEWPVVIAVIGNIKSMQNYISYSRAVTRLLTILWKPI